MKSETLIIFLTKTGKTPANSISLSDSQKFKLYVLYVQAPKPIFLESCTCLRQVILTSGKTSENRMQSQ